ncbi:MAG: tRNA lysidine(34) synthetase TilS [Rhodocyclales bacterium]|nr:tRNA lysidine(34) synthetase TilS [Rhodocyclales bacterium]MBI5781497.1 tRNA lysidine(34) synthetase TilS [Rhodocyclales bacterium]
MVAGLSGGIDSVVLLHVVRALGRPLAAVHVHHGLSPEADHWAGFCQALCESWSIPLQVVRVDVERNSADGLEGAARRARHAVYAGVAADWILLGHHRGDRAETMLFNLLRGAGVRGAGAMPERSGRLLRPLLEVGRADIADYARAHELQWVDDHSNADTRYARNFLRHGILPLIQPRFPAVEQRLASAAARFAEAADLLDDLARLDLGGREPSFPLDIECLAALSEPRARNLLRYLLTRQGVGIPSEERLAEALRQCLAAAPDRHPALAFGRHVMRRKAGRIVLDPA